MFGETQHLEGCASWPMDPPALSSSLPKGLRCFEVDGCPGRILQGGADAVRAVRGEVEVPENIPSGYD